MNRYIEKYNELMSKHDILENSYHSLEMFEKKLEKLTKENEEEFNLLVFDFLDIMIKFWKKSTFSKSKDKYEYLKKEYNIFWDKYRVGLINDVMDLRLRFCKFIGTLYEIIADEMYELTIQVVKFNEKKVITKHHKKVRIDDLISFSNIF